MAKSCATVGDVPNYNLSTARFWHSAIQPLKYVYYVFCRKCYIHLFILMAREECDDSLPFPRASSIPLCYIPFPATLLLQLVFHPASFHLAIYFLVQLLTLLFPNSYIILFSSNYILFYSLYMPRPT